MSALTRIFVCMIPVSAALYFIALNTPWAYRPIFRDQYLLERAARKDDVEKRDKRIEEQRAEIDRLLQDIEQRKIQIVDRDHEIEVKTQQKTDVLIEIEQIRRDTLQIKTDIDNLRENVYKREEALVKMLIAECDVLRQELDEVIADKAHAESRLAQIQDASQKLEADIRATRDKLKETEMEARRKAWILAILDRRNVPIQKIVEEIPLRRDIDAKVIAPDAQAGVYLIDKGEEAGVKPGMRFYVFRGEHYVGEIVVRRVFPTQAAAAEVPETKRMKTDILPGDSATTILYNTKAR